MEFGSLCPASATVMRKPIAGDVEAVRRVEFDLPQTGLCSANRALSEAEAALSCGAPRTPPSAGRAAEPEPAAEAPYCSTSPGQEAAAVEPAA